MSGQLIRGDCLVAMARMDANSVDSIVTDPPYGLGFMGKLWDHGAPGIPFWAEMLRIAKPGAYLLAFGGTRTVHRIAASIEDAGWEIRDMLMWGYATGFPKSLDVGKAIDKAARGFPQGTNRPDPDNPNAGRYKTQRTEGKRDVGDKGQHFGAGPGQFMLEAGIAVEYTPATDDAKKWDGWGTALKPAFEPIVMARKPLSEGTVAANVLRYGTGAINIDGTRIGPNPGYRYNSDRNGTTFHGEQGDRIKQTSDKRGVEVIESQAGRWPANVILTDPIFDGDVEGVVGGGAQESPATYRRSVDADGGVVGWNTEAEGSEVPGYGDTGTYSRFFLIPKASRSERERGLHDVEPRRETAHRRTGDMDTPFLRGETVRHNPHPTVKPVNLMRHLVRLVTPPSGKVLDPFLGSGTTAIAAEAEGFEWIGIEKEAEYAELAKARILGNREKVEA